MGVRGNHTSLEACVLLQWRLCSWLRTVVHIGGYGAGHVPSCGRSAASQQLEKSQWFSSRELVEFGCGKRATELIEGCDARRHARRRSWRSSKGEGSAGVITRLEMGRP